MPVAGEMPVERWETVAQGYGVEHALPAGRDLLLEHDAHARHDAPGRLAHPAWRGAPAADGSPPKDAPPPAHLDLQLASRNCTSTA